MERYKVIKEVGDGTFGSVWRAINKQTWEIVAIKMMKRKYYSWEECMNLREVKNFGSQLFLQLTLLGLHSFSTTFPLQALRRMNHPNIIKLKEVIRENDILYFVFEYMECNLYQLMKTHGRPYSEPEIRNWCFQIFQGLAYMHQRGYFHRDMKPENLLVSKDVVKIADFGLAREICSRPPFTEYVSTRWYRAPETFLSSPTYDSAVDMWAMGAIMAELFTNRPLFPGISEADEIYKICSVIGTPTESSWSEGLLLAQMLNYQFPKLNCVNLSSLLPSASASAIDLISSLCLWDPHKRPTAAVVLQHPFFQSCYYIPPSLRVKDSLLVKTPPSVGISSALEQKGTRRYTNGPVYNAKPTSILTSKPYASLRSGVQRKLEMENQDIGKHATKGYTGQVQYPPYLKNNYSDCVYPVRQAAGVSELTEKLGQMSLMHPLPLQMRHPQSQLQQQQAPALKAGGWHCVAAERGNEIPPAKFYYPRKVRG